MSEQLKGKVKYVNHLGIDRSKLKDSLSICYTEDIASAVQWLKKKIVKGEINKPSTNVFRLIDEAFSDITKKEDHVCKMDFEGVCWGCGRVMTTDKKMLKELNDLLEKKKED